MTSIPIKFWLVAAGLSGAIAVIMGAVGSHALKGQISPEGLEQFHTAVRYHFLHSLALAAAGFLLTLPSQRGSWPGQAAAACFLAGLILFSGSLYGFVFAGLSTLVKVVPIGGFLFIAGWLFFAAAAMRLR